MAHQIKLAIFDIDGTIFRSSLLIELLYGLVEHGIYPKKVLKEISKEHIAWMDRSADYGGYISQVVEVFLRYLPGVTEQDFLATTRHVLKKHKARTYRYTRDLIQQLKREGYYLVAISHSPQMIVSEYCKQLGFSKSFGRLYELENGEYTGRRFNGKIFDFNASLPSKQEIIRSFLKNQLGKFDLKNSIAVGDTESDIPMLELVGRPIAFNPSSLLAVHAKKRKWKIVVERKDVVYELHDTKFLRLGP